MVRDSDVVPRISGVTFGNLALNLIEYHDILKARRDNEQAIKKLQSNVPAALITDIDVTYAMSSVDAMMENLIRARSACAIVVPTGNVHPLLPRWERS